MNDATVFSKCLICGQDFDDRIAAHDGICSVKCRVGRNQIMEIIKDLSSIERDTTDVRVFFYDVGFGKLADLYTVYMLRLLYCESLSLQKEIVIQLDKLEFSLRTKLNKCSLPKELKAKICSRFEFLFSVNAQMWRIRSQANSDIHEYFALSKERDLIRAELDKIIEGHAKTIRI